MIEVVKADDLYNIGDYNIDIHNAVIIPREATNGDMIKAMFPNCEPYENDDIVDVYELGIHCVTFDSDWWNALYKGE